MCEIQEHCLNKKHSALAFTIYGATLNYVLFAV